MLAIARSSDRSQRSVRIDMTRTRTVAQLADRVLGHIIDLGVRTGFIVVRMTAGAGRSIRGIAPGSCIGVGGMAADAGQAQPRVVVTRIFTGSMRKGQRRPRRGGVTDNALTRGGHVSAVLAGRRGAVMACSTATSNANMTERCRLPGQC